MRFDDVLGESVSPIWMVPWEFESKGPDAPLRLRVADEEAQLNPALEYYLRERHKIELPEIPEEPDEKCSRCCSRVSARPCVNSTGK